MPSYPHIEEYHAELTRIIEFGGSDNELSIRPAFQNCLKAYCDNHREKFALVMELRIPSGVVPDGTVKDSLRMAHGYWEAKDTHDDLDAEIESKFNSGYPRDNIIFEDSQTAVLIQNREETMRAEMSSPHELHRLIRRFLDYELPQIEEFRAAQRQFKEDLPTVLDNLRGAIETAEADNSEYRAAAADFLELCRQSISPEVSEADVREMLLQHILTRDIFLRVFGEDQFHRENDIAQQLDALEQTFFTGDVRREAIDRLRSYYGAIGRAADEIADYSEKQGFLKAMYEDFYKAYNPAAADRLGVVYTPNEIVDFMIRGTDHLLQKHFGRSLADRNVQILDPATGTGTFITSLIDYLPSDRLEYKYLNEMHANEVAILPYYIANLNIEYTYKEKTGQYLEFPNLCFVDTLDNMDWQQTGATGGAVTRQGAFNLGGLSTENWMRVQLQNEKTISVIIGNPPYNANQQNWNDFNPNREYPPIDRRIRETYVASSSAHKTKQYDMYKRFIRWASDRLDDNGIVAFITNRSFIDKLQDDGFRKTSLKEFDEIYVIDLGGDSRTGGMGGNVFGIRVGVAITFFIRHANGGSVPPVHYFVLLDKMSRVTKLSELSKLDVRSLALTHIEPDSQGSWINKSNPQFRALMGFVKPKLSAKDDSDENSLFALYSTGAVTNRDNWVYDIEVRNLESKVKSFIRIYEANRAIVDKDESNRSEIDKRIKWTPDLIRKLHSDTPIAFDRSSIRMTLYRPYVNKYLYFNSDLNWSRYRLPQVFPLGATTENKVICFQSSGARRPFAALATNRIADLHLFFDGTQCLPLYRYTAEGNRVCNITDWGIRHINEHYRDDWGKDFQETYPDGISAEEIFAYTYAVLHDPVYRHDYRVDLLREFPRLPLYHDFDIWARMGRELLDLHINFESAEPYPLERHDKAPPAKVAEDNWTPKARLRADKERSIITLERPDHAFWCASRRMEIRPRQPLRPRMGARPVQGEEAQRPHHQGEVQHLPVRRLQRAGDRPPQACLHSQRKDDGDRRRHGLLGRRQACGVRGQGQR